MQFIALDGFAQRVASLVNLVNVIVRSEELTNWIFSNVRCKLEVSIGGLQALRDLFGTSMDVRHALGTGRCSKTHHAGHPGAEFTGL